MATNNGLETREEAENAVREMFHTVGAETMAREIQGGETDMIDPLARKLEAAVEILGRDRVGDIIGVDLESMGPLAPEVAAEAEREGGEQMTLGGEQADTRPRPEAQARRERPEGPQRELSQLGLPGEEAAEEEEGELSEGRGEPPDAVAVREKLEDRYDEAMTGRQAECSAYVDALVEAVRVLIEEQPSPFDDDLDDLQQSLDLALQRTMDGLRENHCAIGGRRSALRNGIDRLQDALENARPTAESRAREFVETWDGTRVERKFTWADLRDRVEAIDVQQDECFGVFGSIDELIARLGKATIAMQTPRSAQEGTPSVFISEAVAIFERLQEQLEKMDCYHDEKDADVLERAVQDIIEAIQKPNTEQTREAAQKADWILDVVRTPFTQRHRDESYKLAEYYRTADELDLVPSGNGWIRTHQMPEVVWLARTGDFAVIKRGVAGGNFAIIVENDADGEHVLTSAIAASKADDVVNEFISQYPAGELDFDLEKIEDVTAEDLLEERGGDTGN